MPAKKGDFGNFAIFGLFLSVNQFQRLGQGMSYYLNIKVNKSLNLRRIRIDLRGLSGIYRGIRENKEDMVNKRDIESY